MRALRRARRERTDASAARTSPLVVPIAILLLGSLSGTVALRRSYQAGAAARDLVAHAPPEIAALEPTTPAPSPPARASSAAAKPSPRAGAQSRRASRSQERPPAWMFGGLGAWIDVYDFELNPARTAAAMRRRGVRTLYIQTGRWNLPFAVVPQVGPWLLAAHREGLQVVGWYLPGYGKLGFDVRRTLAIARYSYRGHRFDGLGIDIEWRGSVRSRGVWNSRVARHARQVRSSLGPDYLIAAITPSPLQMRLAPRYWAGFPWRQLARVSDVVMTMSYWSYRTDCPRRRVHCPFEYTVRDVQLARRLTGRSVPIHVIGGVGDAVNAREVREFARGAATAGAFGASFYDYLVTDSSQWRYLVRLRTL